MELEYEELALEFDPYLGPVPSCLPNSQWSNPQVSSSRNIFCDDLQIQMIYTKRKN